MRRYTTSKLCNLLFTYELDRRLRAAGQQTPLIPITVNAYDPGPVPGTGLIRDWHTLVAYLVKSPLIRLLGAQISDVQTSGAAMARLVLDPALSPVSGTYFQINQPRRSSLASYDGATARALWEASAELVGLTSAEQLAPGAVLREDALCMLP
jgi:NAD(P)-dependent dehydrogenase (short-subunit alcohol dehydrogenase family)